MDKEINKKFKKLFALKPLDQDFRKKLCMRGEFMEPYLEVGINTKSHVETSEEGKEIIERMTCTICEDVVKLPAVICHLCNQVICKTHNCFEKYKSKFGTKCPITGCKGKLDETSDVGPILRSLLKM